MPNLIANDGLNNLAEYIEPFFSHFELVINEVTETFEIYDYYVEGELITIEVLLEEKEEEYTIEKIQLIDTDGNVFAETNEDITVPENRLFYKKFTFELSEVAE